MTSQELAKQLEAMQAQLAALAKENEQLKKNPPKNGSDWGKPVRVVKTSGKIQVKYKTQIDINLMHGVMLACKMKDVMAIAKEARSLAWERRPVFWKKKGGESIRQSYDNIFVTRDNGEEVLVTTVPLAKLADNSPDTNPDSPANKAELKKRIEGWDQLWKDLEDRTKK